MKRLSDGTLSDVNYFATSKNASTKVKYEQVESQITPYSKGAEAAMTIQCIRLV